MSIVNQLWPLSPLVTIRIVVSPALSGVSLGARHLGTPAIRLRQFSGATTILSHHNLFTGAQFHHHNSTPPRTIFFQFPTIFLIRHLSPTHMHSRFQSRFHQPICHQPEFHPTVCCTCKRNSVHVGLGPHAAIYARGSCRTNPEIHNIVGWRYAS